MFEKFVEQLTRNDAPRWMVTKDGLDHGPFTGRDLMSMLLRGEVLAEHDVQNLDERTRKSAQDYAILRPFLDHFATEHQKNIHAASKVKRIQDAYRTNALKATVIAALLGMMGWGTWTFITSRREHREIDATRKLADMYEKGAIQIKGSVGILPSSRRASRGGRLEAETKSASSGRVGSFEEAMQRATDLGDITDEGNETQLSTQQIAQILNQKVRSFSGCVGAAIRNSERLGQVQVDLAIAGSGKVIGSTVHQGSAEFQRCIEQKVAEVVFPKFGLPRMGARYTFSVN